jgi:hypothetical protein
LFRLDDPGSSDCDHHHHERIVSLFVHCNLKIKMQCKVHLLNHIRCHEVRRTMVLVIF